MEASRAHDGRELDDLAPGTRQRAQLRARVADIASTALCVVLALWALWSIVGTMRGTEEWAYSAVACVLLAIALTARTVALRRGNVQSGR
ncbi:hypothetical protein [Streptomyces prasinopilosus]|uniref:Integral membrane protein n=1 Tax=Streptomyces prasinopilosus TaxID=67344 RepID=A0A1G6T5Z9_9ACTN|nr:hypothetical protein [Streptomyces prasinopilosus]SDD24469.1 hypothetical protein SAMN05216505_10648 [Streptomyces prasinopilosus]